MHPTPPVRTLGRAAVGCGCVGVIGAAGLRLTSGPTLPAMVLGLVVILASLGGLLASGAGMVLARSVRPFVAGLALVTVATVAAAEHRVVSVDLVFGGLVAIVWSSLAVRAHRRVVRASDLDPMRRRLQLALTWALPCFGPLVVLAFYRSLDPLPPDGYDPDRSDWYLG